MPLAPIMQRHDVEDQWAVVAGFHVGKQKFIFSFGVLVPGRHELIRYKLDVAERHFVVDKQYSTSLKFHDAAALRATGVLLENADGMPDEMVDAVLKHKECSDMSSKHVLLELKPFMSATQYKRHDQAIFSRTHALIRESYDEGPRSRSRSRSRSSSRQRSRQSKQKKYQSSSHTCSRSTSPIIRILREKQQRALSQANLQPHHSRSKIPQPLSGPLTA